MWWERSFEHNTPKGPTQILKVCRTDSLGRMAEGGELAGRGELGCTDDRS